MGVCSQLKRELSYVYRCALRLLWCNYTVARRFVENHPLQKGQAEIHLGTHPGTHKPCGILP